jgi:hypothetical protein
VDTDVAVEADADAASTAADGVEVVGGAPRTRLINFRNAVFFAAFFGLTGTLFTLLGIGSLLTPPFALAGGAAAAGSVHYLMRHLADSDSGDVPGPEEFEGAPAEVMVDIQDKGFGKIA